MSVPMSFVFGLVFGFAVTRLLPGGVGAFLLIILVLIEIIIISIMDVIDVIKSETLSFFSKFFWILMFPVLIFWILWMSLFTGDLFNEAILSDASITKYARDDQLYGYVFNQFIIALSFLILPRKEKVILIPLYTFGIIYWINRDYQAYYDVYQFWYGFPMFFFAIIVVMTMLIRRMKHEAQQHQQSLGWRDI